MDSEKNIFKKDTNFLRFLAIVLITNSHLDLYYPNPKFATGGAVGNSLFFLLSSFGLFLSGRKKTQTFIEWYTRRIVRIYPSVWILLIALYIPIKVLKHSFEIKDMLLYFSYFFYPPVWFLQALMVYYIIIYFIIKFYDKIKIYYIFLIIFGTYFYIYSLHIDLSKWAIELLPFSLLFYLSITIYGIYVSSINNKIRYSGFQDWFILFSFIALIYTHKFLMTKNLLLSVQFIQQALLFPAVYYFLKISRSPSIQKHIMEMPIISNCINYISSITLEIYLVQTTLITLSVIDPNIIFPLNVIILITATIAISALIKYLNDKFNPILYRL